MAVTVSDGGGQPPRPTETTAAGSTPPGGSKRRERLGPVPSGASRPTTTAFNRSPVAADRTTPRLDQAVRLTSTATPTDSDVPNRRVRRRSGATTTGAAPVSSPTSADAAERRALRGGSSTGSRPAVDPGNSGRADTLVTTPHEGRRDARIAELRAEHASLQERRDEIHERVEEIGDEIDSDEGTRDTIGKVAEVGVSIVTSPVTAVASLFGKPNPIADAAEGAVENAAEWMLDLEEDREQLETEERSLAAKQGQIEAQIEELENEVVLNAVTESLHVVGAGTAVVGVMDGATRDIEVVSEESELGQAINGDAAYVYQEDRTAVTQSYVDTVKEKVEQLQEDGIIDEDGNVVDAEGFDQAVVGDSLLAAGALIAVHEEEHARQDGRGEVVANRAAMQANDREAAAAVASGVVDPLTAVRDAELENEIYQIVREELDAYDIQGASYQPWGVQRTENRVDLTTDAEGNKLPDAVAAARIFNFRYTGDPGDLEQQLAGHAGSVRSEGGEAAGDAEIPAGSDVPEGRRILPGDDVPEGRRILPGEDLPEGRRILPGEDLPEGRRILPGETLPEGRRILPGEDLPFGRRILPGGDMAEGGAHLVGTAPRAGGAAAADAARAVEVVEDLSGLDVDATAIAVRDLIAPEARAAFEQMYGLAAEEDPEGRRILPGEDLPEGRRILPGEDLPEGRRILPGESLPEGRRILPGESLPEGRRILPGESLPEGRRILPGEDVRA